MLKSLNPFRKWVNFQYEVRIIAEKKLPPLNRNVITMTFHRNSMKDRCNQTDINVQQFSNQTQQF